MKATILAVLILFAATSSQPPSPSAGKDTHSINEPSEKADSTPAIENAYVIVNAVHVQKAQQPERANRKQEDEKPSNDWWVNIALVIVGFLQALILIAHAISFRSAEDTKRKQLRAYITPTIGQAVYQAVNLKFEGKPSIVNMGQTPAYKVRSVARAEILPVPLPPGFQFPDLGDPPPSEGVVLGPKQANFLSAVVAERVEDNEVDNIRSGKDKAMYVWATVTYEDVFGRPHVTRLAQKITFSNDNKVIFVQYPYQHNNSD